MNLAIQRTPTRTGQRIHFEGCPAHSYAPQFCEGHPMAERDHALSATFLPAPFGALVPRRWRVGGKTLDTLPEPTLAECDDDDEVLE